VPLINALLKQKKLVAPFRGRYATTRAYFIVRAQHASSRSEAQAFMSWLQDEARAEMATSDAPAEAVVVPRAPRSAR